MGVSVLTYRFKTVVPIFSSDIIILIIISSESGSSFRVHNYVNKIDLILGT